jgi:hypothetical protein
VFLLPAAAQWQREIYVSTIQKDGISAALAGTNAG